MTVIGFPAVPEKEWNKPKTLEDWPWEKDLGKPTPIDSSYVPEPPVTGTFNNKGEFIYSLEREDKTNPPHYKHLGIECIDLTENMGFLEGNIVKYVYRYAAKGGSEDLDKADWYLQRLRTKRRESNDAGC